MHILHVIDGLAIGGAERMLVDIANATIGDGLRVSACVTRTQTDLASDLDPGIEQIILNRTQTFDFAAFQRFNDFIQQNQVTVIHAHGRSSFSFAAFARILRSHKVPIILHDHYGSIETDRTVPTWFRVWGRKQAAAYIGVYQKLGDWAVLAGIPKRRVFVIGNAIELQRMGAKPSIKLKEEFGIESGTLVGAVVGGLRREKGIDLLIESLSTIDNNDYKLLIVGGARDPIYVRECKRLAEQSGIAEKLIFIGERADVPKIIASIDFGLIPSRSESGPLILIEYMAAGLPIIAFCVGDIAQTAAQCGVQGFVAPNDTSIFASHLIELLNMPHSARRERGAFGKKVAQERFSIQAKMSEFYEVYRRVQELR